MKRKQHNALMRLFRWFFVISVCAILPCLVLYSTYQSYLVSQQIHNHSIRMINKYEVALNNLEIAKQILAEDTDSNYPRVPKNVLFSHYRVSVKTPDAMKQLFPLGDFVSIGTATAIGPNQLLTCGHLFRSVKYRNISFPLDRSQIYLDVFSFDSVLITRVPVTIERVLFDLNNNYSEYDLALISVKTPLKYFTSLDYTVETKIEINEPLYLVGAAHGDVPFNVKRGELLSYASVFLPSHWYGSMISSPGQSGGGVYTSDNKLCGITCRKIYVAGSLFMGLTKINHLLSDDWEKYKIESETK